MQGVRRRRSISWYIISWEQYPGSTVHNSWSGMNSIVLIVSAVVASALAAPQYTGVGHRQFAHNSLGAAPAYQGPPVVPVILPGGFIADTEEVAKAKELHFNAFANAASNVKDSKYNPTYQEEQPRYTQVSHQPLYTPAPAPAPIARQQDYNVPQQRYTGPVASKVSYAAPAAAKGPAYQQPAYVPQQRYKGPPVIPVILPNGYIAETADVEAAKEHHFQLYAAAQAAAARAQERAGAKKYTNAYTAPAAYSEDDGSQYEEEDQRYNQVYSPQPSAVYNTPQKAQSYRGPPVVPVVLPTGHIADTAEVAAAKISHLQQLLDAAQKSLPQQRYR